MFERFRRRVRSLAALLRRLLFVALAAGLLALGPGLLGAWPVSARPADVGDLDLDAGQLNVRRG